jgi:hypothetical protein
MLTYYNLSFRTLHAARCRCLLNGYGAIGCIMMFFLGEVTSPLFNVFSVSK